ncbi:hypothetical protein [Alistipes sp.]|uniref:hypothetical protein n=1 Tax=Alistipes sp. TaxID=1872444 RepID=UPI003AF03830
MILIYLIIIALGLVALYLAAIAVVYMICFLVVGVQLALGKTTIDELNKKVKLAEQAKQAKAEQENFKPKKSGAFWFLSLPAPLNHWGLWH